MLLFGAVWKLLNSCMQIHINTPLIRSTPLSNKFATNVWLKMEALQPCGSFKARGVGYACNHYVQQGAKSLVCSSGGNAGLAVAYSGRILAVPVTVVVPESTKAGARVLIKNEGAEVIVHGQVWDDAHEYALGLVGEDKAYIHPFDDVHIWQGHASIIDEVVQAGLQPDLIILSVGGGGLLCGVLEGAANNSLLDIPVLAVETSGAASLHYALQTNSLASLEAVSSIASSLGAKQVASRAFELAKERKVLTHQVSDGEAVAACLQFIDDHRVVTEPACGASLAAVYGNHCSTQNKDNVLVIVCGGAGTCVDDLLVWNRQLNH